MDSNAAQSTGSFLLTILATFSANTLIVVIVGIPAFIFNVLKIIEWVENRRVKKEQQKNKRATDV